MNSIPMIFKGMCPNCGGDIYSYRLEKGLLCKSCIKEEIEREKICMVLKEGNFTKVCSLFDELQKFKKVFKDLIKNDMWSIQETWAKRFFLDISFALLAPTGIGKTTFGLILSKYLTEKDNKVYLIFPTQLLVNQGYEKLINFGIKEDKILPYSSKFAKSKKKQEELKKRISEGDFNILITTTMFLYKNIDLIPKNIFSLVFIDDVDSILKTAKNIDKVLMLLGFSEDEIEETLKFISFKQNIFKKQKPSDKDLEIFNRWQEKIRKISEKRNGVLIVSSATSNPKSKRVALFRELLGFEVGKPSLTLRNIVDVYEKTEDIWKTSLEKIRHFGKGGLVFLSSSESKEKLDKYVDFLNENGINAVSYENIMENIDRFRSGEIDVAVGFASYRNPLARGIDLPDVVRYALFVGVPKLQFNIRFEEEFVHLYYFLIALIPFLVKKNLIQPLEVKELYSDLNFLKIYGFLPEDKLDPEKKNKLISIRQKVKTLVESEKIFNEIKNSPEITIKDTEDGFIFITADATGYIQASGRTSRLYAGGLTKGLAYLLVDDEKAFYSLQKKVKWFSDEINFKKFNEINIDEILKEIDEDRKKVKEILSGKSIPSERKSFKTTVVIVESPNKARTIANFFGKPLRRKIKNLDAYEIAIGERFLTIIASKGHVFDLNKDEGVFGVRKNGEFIPVFEPIDEDRKKIVEAVRELDLEVEEVFIATDPDTEGEKISYDIYLNSRPYNFDIKRAEFHEVTKRAFLEAVENYRDIDRNLVKAQLIRRISDRWIGFSISQYLQKKLHSPHLSAGRVQTPVLEWIIERADQAKRKKAVVNLKIDGINVEFEFDNQKNGKIFYEKIRYVFVEPKESKEEKLFIKPFSTDTLLMTASKELKFSPQEIMDLAQDLFEMGYITYHRTDSIRVSEAGVRIAKEYIKENFGEEYIKIRTYKGAGGAHECIRPTKAIDVEELKSLIFLNNIQGLTKKHLNLYDLIFRHFIASQMRETVVLKNIYTVKGLNYTTEIELISKIIQHGYDLIIPIETKVLNPGKYDITDKKFLLIPSVSYYTFATVIQDMKEKGIGRPSTYAITIQKLIDRHYIVVKKGFLFPTTLGRKVMKILKEREDIFRFVEENFTKELESIMDLVEEGKADYQLELKKLYDSLHKKLPTF